jgi:hypothetical protein
MIRRLLQTAAESYFETLFTVLKDHPFGVEISGGIIPEFRPKLAFALADIPISPGASAVLRGALQARFPHKHIPGQ